MSELQNDQEVAQGKRKEKLKDVEANLRDQIPVKLAEKLDEMKMGQKIVSMWTMGQANRQALLDRHVQYLKDWDEFLESTAEGPFQGSSSIHLPITLIVCRAAHARFMQALFGVDPFHTIKARRSDSIDKAATVQELMGYALKDWVNCYQGIEEAADVWVWNWITEGSGILKTKWAENYTRYVDVVTEPYTSVQYSTDPEGNTVTTPVLKTREVEKKVTKAIFAGPEVEPRQIEDVLLINGCGNPEKADAVIEMYGETASNLWTLADRKIFRDDIVREVIAHGPDNAAEQLGSNLKQERAQNAFMGSNDSNADLDRYSILEAYLRVDVDGSGINSDVVVWVHKNSMKILRATYLHRINKSGKRPYSIVHFHKRPTADYGVGLPELMHPLAKELDAMHSISVDYGMLSTMPFGFYRPTSSLDPETIELQPGALIPLDNPQADVYFPNLGNRAPFGAQQEMTLTTYIERLTGFSDINFGIQSGNQGATRTATGARVLATENNTNLDILLKRLNRGWKTTLEYILHMLQQRIPQGLSFRVTGETGDDYWRTIRSAEDIEGDYDFELVPNSSASNRLIQQDQATQVFQFTQNPLLIQAGVVSTGNIYEAAKDYLRALGVKNFAKYCQKPADYRLILSPEEEANRVLRGEDVPVMPESDHAGFLTYFQTVFKSDELLGQFGEQQSMMLAQQAQKHEAMMQALQAAQAQQANVAQARQNSQNNQQAVTTMSPPQGAPQEMPA